MSVLGPGARPILPAVTEGATTERRTRLTPRSIGRMVAIPAACLSLTGTVAGAVEVYDAMGPHTDKVKSSLVRTETIDTYRTSSGGYRTVDHISTKPEYTTRERNGSVGGFFLWMGDILGGGALTVGLLAAGPEAVESRVRRIQDRRFGGGIER